MEMRGLMGGFYKLSEWIMRLAVTNILWLVTSFPFWFWLISSYLSFGNVPDDQVGDQVRWVMIVIAVIAPFTFFPSTSAMFSVARKWVLGDVDVPLLKTFFRSYKTNYKQAMLGGILYSLLFAILITDFEVYSGQLKNLQLIAYLFIALMVLALVSVLHFFSLLSHFHMKTFQLIKNSLVLTIGRPIRSIMMVLGTVVVVYISFRFTFLLPFFCGSIIAWYTFFNFNHIIQKMMALKETLETPAAESAETSGEALPDGDEGVREPIGERKPD